MGQGVPLRPGTGEGEAGAAGAHMLDVGLNSTGRIAASFGLSMPKWQRRAPQGHRPRRAAGSQSQAGAADADADAGAASVQGGGCAGRG